MCVCMFMCVWVHMCVGILCGLYCVGSRVEGACVGMHCVGVHMCVVARVWGYVCGCLCAFPALEFNSQLVLVL